MSRSNLLSFLPDLSEGPPPKREPRVPGFEPLVTDAASRPEFAPIDMTSCFIGEETPPDPMALQPLEEPGGDTEIGSLGFDIDGPPLDPEPVSPNDGVIMDLDLTAEPDPFPESPVPDTPAEIAALEQPAAGTPDEAAEIPTEAYLQSVREEIDQVEAVYQTALQDMIEKAIPRAREQVVDAVFEQLAPFLARHMRASMADRMISALIAELGEILDTQEALTFELTGPESLLRRFEEQWPHEPRPAKLVPSDGIDLVARVGKSVLATRLAEVDRMLQEVVA